MWSLTDADVLIVVCGLLGALAWYQWNEHVLRVKTLQAGHYALKDTLKEDYWNKSETQQHIGLVLKPMEQSLNAVAQSNEKLTGEIRNLTNALATSAIYRGINGSQHADDVHSENTR